MQNGKPRASMLVHLELLFVVAIWSGTYVSTKIVLTQIPPAVSALYRYLIASAVLLVLNRKNREKVERGDYKRFVLLGLTGVTLYYLLQHYAIRYTSAIDASILISLSPAFIGLICWLFLKERISLLAGVGLLIALVGSYLVIGDGQDHTVQGSARLIGNCLILLTAICWAVYSVLGKKMLEKYSARTLIAYTTLIGTALLAPVSLLELRHATNFMLDVSGWLHMLYLGGAASVYGYLAWYRALEKLPAVTVGSYLYFRPLLTGIIAALALGERIGAMAAVGGALILAGTYLSTKTAGAQKTTAAEGKTL